MIPILYQGNEQDFDHNGLGRLSDAISCIVTEEHNGVFELEMTYPITGIHYADIEVGMIIFAKTEEGGNNQAFIIYKISRPLNGVVTIDAEHISYLLNGFAVMPFTGASCADTFSQIASHMAVSTPFSFYTDIDSSIRFTLSEPRTARNVLGGQQGSILDVYGGGDYKFDNFDVRLLAHRGNDNGVTIRYGKNLTELKNVDDSTNVYTGIVPYWVNPDTGESFYLTEKAVYNEHADDYPYKILRCIDFSGDFETQPTQAQLKAAAESYIEAHENSWKINNNIDVSFVNLSQTEEYKDILALERVRLCDIVTIIYEKLGVDVKTKVIKTVYNVLTEKYDKISLGDTTYSLAKAVQQAIDAPTSEDMTSFIQASIDRATKLIQGGLGGHVVFNTNADGEPEEILIMDTDDIMTAVNVIRMNLNGIGFSHNGYNGPFTTAWTVDGHFVADFIDTGNLNAGLLKVGTITDRVGTSYWNLETGEFHISTGAYVGNQTLQNIFNSIGEQIDGKAETWHQAADPANAWTTDADKAKHKGDLWYKTTDDTTWFYDYTNGVYSWKPQNIPKEVFDEIDGKAQVFVSQPVPPYSEGDIWFVGATGDILTCMTDRAEGQSFVQTDWQKKNKYTDDTEAYNVRDALNLRIDGVVGEFDLKISGIFANYTGSAVPTTSNYPASSWADADKPLHVGEVYYKTPQTEQDTGVYYRYTETSGVYSWEVIDTTDGNYAVVSSEFRQTKSLISQEVSKSETTINNSINENFANYVKTSTPTTSNSPASSWTTDALKLQHNGDICYNKNNGRYYKWTVTFNADGSINTANWVQQTVSHKYDLVTSTSKSRMEQTENSFSIAVGAERTAREQADLAATYNYTGTTAPTNPWTDADRNHVGEIYYRSDTQQYYVFEQTAANTYAWVPTTPSRAFDLTTTSSLARFNMAEDEILLEVSKSEKRLFANYTGSVTPTNNNYPASSWTTSAQRKEHVNEVYYDMVAGKYYKYGARKPNQVQIQIRYATESPYDYLNIIVPNAANNTASVYKITGGDTSSQSSYSIKNINFEIPDDNIYFKWHTDSSNSYYGYHFNAIRKVYNGDNPTTEPDEIVTNPTYPSSPSSFQSDSAHPYANNQDIDFIAITSELPILSPGYEWSEIATDDMPFSTVSSQIRQTAEEISLKVSKGDVVSEINLSTDAITLNTAGRLIITAGNFQLDAQGNLTAANATLTGAAINDGTLEMTSGTKKLRISNAIINFYENDVLCGRIASEYSEQYSQEFLSLESNSQVQIVSEGDTVISSKALKKGVRITPNGVVKITTTSGYNSIEAGNAVVMYGGATVKNTLLIDGGIDINWNGTTEHGKNVTLVVGSKNIVVRHGIITDVY